MAIRSLPSSTLLINKARSKAPALPYAKMKESVLGPSYTLSIAFIGRDRSRILNRRYRGKDNATNVLSFPVSRTEGEIYLCTEVIRREQKKFGRNFSNLVAFLLIHGLVHLKGFDHGSRMESHEKRIRRAFGI